MGNVWTRAMGSGLEEGHVMRKCVNWFVMLSLPVVAAGSGKPTEAASPVERSSQTVITNSIGMRLVLIPAGEFTMGSPGSDKDVPIDEKPQHRVRITRPFFLGAYEVTVGQFRQFVKETGRKTEDIPTKGGLVSWNNPGWQQTDEHPAVWVNWHEAVAFCGWLSRKEGKTYRLPAEAEWEYACRAGSASRYTFGDDARELGEYAWFSPNSRGSPQPVGQKKPNGNRGAGQAEQVGTRSATTPGNWESMRGSHPTPAAALNQSVKRSRMLGACSICTGTCGSGVRTGTARNTTPHPL